MDDIFCKIVRGEIPSAKVYEDDDVFAFLDISQSTKGHTLVIPKEHYDNALVCPQETLHKVYDVAQKIGKAFIENFGAKGINILTNAGEEAGQSVMHFHVHVIPRYSKDIDGFDFLIKSHEVSSEELSKLANKIADCIN